VFKAKAMAFKAKAKDLQKKQGQGQALGTKAKKYSRPTLRTSKSHFHSDTLVAYCIYQIMQSNRVCPSSTIK